MKRAPRQTPQRTAIRQAIERTGDPLSPKEILQLARRAGARELGMATVYRALKHLCEEGVIKSVEIPGDAPRFEMSGKEHHHHFSCRDCGKVFELPGCCGHFHDLAPQGFVVDGHELVLFGQCPQCSRD